jgi:predicted RNase H-like nuclease (RuvC/YqgF family)
MRFSIFVRTTALLSVGLAATFAAVAQDPASQQVPDPMAAAARKARAEQQNAPKPKKVYTNDDFAPPPAPKVTEAKPGGAQADADAKADSELTPENNPKSERYWRNKFSKVRDKLSMAEKEVEVLQRELDKNQVQYYSDPQKALTQQFNRKDINENRAKLDAKQKEVDSLKQQLSDLEDDLRKAGGDPGWAR